jgi:hypothetical protein
MLVKNELPSTSLERHARHGAKKALDLSVHATNDLDTGIYDNRAERVTLRHKNDCHCSMEHLKSQL